MDGAATMPETGWHRARRDWWHFFGSGPGAVMGIVVTVANILFAAFFIAPIAGGFWQAIVALIAFLAIEGGAILITLGWFVRRTPYLQRDEARVRVEELGELRRPRIDVVALQENQFHKSQGGYLLQVTNKGLDALQNCYVRLEKLIWKTYAVNAEQVQRDYCIQMFSTDDLYFHWKSLGEERLHTFVHSAISVIAQEVPTNAGEDRYALSALGVNVMDFRLLYAGPYFMVIQIGASNHDLMRRFYKLVPSKHSYDAGEWIEIEENDVPQADAGRPF